jgi:putative transposase
MTSQTIGNGVLDLSDAPSMKHDLPAASEKRTKGRFNRTQIIEMLREHENGMRVPQLCRKYNVSRTTFYKWRAKFADAVQSETPSPEDKRIATLQDENHRLKKLLGDVVLENSGLKETLAKKGSE